MTMLGLETRFEQHEFEGLKAPELEERLFRHKVQKQTENEENEEKDPKAKDKKQKATGKRLEREESRQDAQKRASKQDGPAFQRQQSDNSSPSKRGSKEEGGPRASVKRMGSKRIGSKQEDVPKPGSKEGSKDKPPEALPGDRWWDPTMKSSWKILQGLKSILGGKSLTGEYLKPSEPEFDVEELMTMLGLETRFEQHEFEGLKAPELEERLFRHKVQKQTENEENEEKDPKAKDKKQKATGKRLEREESRQDAQKRASKQDGPEFQRQQSDNSSPSKRAQGTQGKLALIAFEPQACETRSAFLHLLGTEGGG